MVPHISPSRLRYGTHVYCCGMGQSRIYTILYPHLADYMAITLPKGTLWGHGAIHYGTITSIRIAYAITVMWYDSVSPIRVHVTMSTLQYNVMVPHICPSRLHYGTQVCYFGMAHSLICTMPYPSPHLATYSIFV